MDEKMGKIDDYTVQKVKDAARIEDVVGDFVELRKSGVRYVGLCPLHDDTHTGNFVVYPPKNIFYCFACEAKGGPVEFVMRHLNLSFPDAIRCLGRKYGIETDGEEVKFTPPAPRPAPKQLPMLSLPFRMVKARENLQGDALVAWIYKGVNWDAAQRKRIDMVLEDYHVGHSRQGMTIFWQIDDKQVVRTGKMMLYGLDGHRNRQVRYNFDYIHAALFRDRRLPEYDATKMEVRQCLFGLHLIDRETDVRRDVCIVESEKTALLMAIAYGNHAKQLWMACGGLQNLTEERLRPVIDRGLNIVVYPDRDGVKKWKEKAAEIHYDRLVVDDRPVTEWWREGDGEKADIADVVIRMINEKKIYKTVGEVIEDLPQLKVLHEKLQLEIIDNGTEEQ